MGKGECFDFNYSLGCVYPTLYIIRLLCRAYHFSLLSCYPSSSIKGKIIVTNPDNDAYDKKLALKNNAPFTSCISKITNTLIDNAEDLDIVMPMYNLLEYSKNYKKTTGSLWNYYRDESSTGAVGNVNYSIKNSKSFDYKTSIIGKLEGNNAEKDDFEIVVPLKFLSNFFRSLNIVLVNCEVSLTLTWSENCVITSKATRDSDADPAVIKITDCKLYFQ